jgi:ribose-phosphate pyrophosphokinase
MSNVPPLIFSGNANRELSNNIVSQLRTYLASAEVNQFSDGEVAVQINANVRGRDSFIVQPTCAPSNDNLMELLIMADTLKRSSAERIVAVIPYFGYSRQDKRARSGRVPITAKLVANLIETAGIDHILTVDLHSDQLQGFFDIPVDNIYGSPVLLNDIQARKEYESGDLMIVSPDVGGVVRARAIANSLDVDLAIIDKRRPKANESKVMNLIGDVEGKTCVLVDDMIDTAGTLCKAAAALKERGATNVYAYATHPVFSGPAIDNIGGSELNEVVVTDTIPLSKAAKKCDKVRQITLSGVLAEAIRRIHNEESISVMFQ